jgi:hypothetical protein
MNIKVKNNSIFAVILKENKAVHFESVKTTKDSFRHENHVYFIENTGAYLNDKNKFLVMVWLEGVSLPISHKYIKYEYITKKIQNDITGKTETHKIRQIKDLNFDSKAISIILNQKLAEMFTRIPMDLPNFLLALLLIATVIIGIINIGMWFL